MKITVTGHKGFIGSKVFFKLRVMGMYPVGVDQGDSVPDSDVIVHCAALLDNSKKMEENNNAITREVIRHTNKVVFTSSVGVYPNFSIPHKEEDRLEPITRYGKAKMFEEKLIRDNCKEYSILRLSNVWGYNSDHGYISSLLRGNRIIYDQGIKTRDYVFVDDVVNVLIEAALTDKWNGIYNIASGKSISTKELFKRMMPTVRPISRHKEEIIHSNIDITKALVNGFKPFVL